MKRGKSLVVGAIVTIVALLGFGVFGALTTQAITDTRDCQNGDIIHCGVTSLAELRQKYAANATHDLPAIYSHYGISSAMINGSSAKDGYVTQTGNVVYNGKTVATGAYTAGRLGYPSSHIITIGGTKIYEHSTQTSFRVSSIRAFVWFDSNGQFVAAILKSCGNPVWAHPVPVPPKPVYACNALTPTKISRNEYSFTTNATAKNGATIVSYVYNFGDGVIATNGATVRHTYAKAGTYRVTATVKVSVNGRTVDAPGNCVATVEVAPAPCLIPGKTQYPADDARCVEDKPAVTIEKTVNGAKHDTVAINAPFTYQIIVKNIGNIALKNVVVTDKAPANVTFDSAATGTIANNAWTYTIANLGVGQSQQFSIIAKLTAYQSGDITNTACVETPTVPGGNPDKCDTATIDTPQSIQVCKLDDKTIVTITPDQYDETKYSKDMSKCAVPVAATEVPPAELPHTGIADALGGSLGMGGMAGAVYYYGASRRQLRDAMLRQ